MADDVEYLHIYNYVTGVHVFGEILIETNLKLFELELTVC